MTTQDALRAGASTPEASSRSREIQRGDSASQDVTGNTQRLREEFSEIFIDSISDLIYKKNSRETRKSSSTPKGAFSSLQLQ